MSNANIGWLFYRKMYEKGNDDNHIKSTMEKLLNVNAKDESFDAKQNFRLKTLYPGLIIGSGYTHGLSSDHDSKVGFYFDHTTGLPLIQGSSIKGVLRSCFGLEFGNQVDSYKKEKHEFIRDLMAKEGLDVEALAKDIFEGVDSESLKVKSIYNRDIFYEARVIATDKFLLRDDYITPHGEDSLKNPTPLHFVKVAPEVTFEFSFDLKDSPLATADEKKKLFMDLLETFGVGAKTNVGYGQFEVVLTDEEKAEMEKEKAKKEAEVKARKLEEEQKKKEDEKKARDAEAEALNQAKEAKKQDGLNALLDCKTLAEGFKLLKDAFGKVPKPSKEDKVIIEEYYKKQKNLSNSDKKVFKKYGMS